MLTLGTRLEMTQADLAKLLGVTRKAIGRREAGETYPNAPHLQALLTFALEQHAFPVGREEEELRSFWLTANQKVLLDELWLQEVLRRQHPRLTLLMSQHSEAISSDLQTRAQPVPGPRVDWDDALVVLHFYGRTEELTVLMQWVIEERSRVVSVLGLGGIGKSALTAHLMHRVAPHFQVVIWRSLRDAPECSILLDECLQVLAPRHSVTSRSVSKNISASCLRICGALVFSWYWTIWKPS